MKALSINENVLETNFNYATFLQSLGRYEQAEKYYRKTLKINQNFTKADKSLAMLKKYKKMMNIFIYWKKKLKIEILISQILKN